MDQEPFEQTVSQFKKSISDIPKADTTTKKQTKPNTPHHEPSILDEPAIADIPIQENSKAKKPDTKLEEEVSDAKQLNLWLLFGLAIFLGAGLGVGFAVLLVSGEVDLPLKDVKRIFKTIASLGSYLN